MGRLKFGGFSRVVCVDITFFYSFIVFLEIELRFLCFCIRSSVLFVFFWIRRFKFVNVILVE